MCCCFPKSTKDSSKAAVGVTEGLLANSSPANNLASPRHPLAGISVLSMTDPTQAMTGSKDATSTSSPEQSEQALEQPQEAAIGSLGQQPSSPSAHSFSTVDVGMLAPSHQGSSTLGSPGGSVASQMTAPLLGGKRHSPPLSPVDSAQTQPTPHINGDLGLPGSGTLNSDEPPPPKQPQLMGPPPEPPRQPSPLRRPRPQPSDVSLGGHISGLPPRHPHAPVAGAQPPALGLTGPSAFFLPPPAEQPAIFYDIISSYFSTIGKASDLRTIFEEKRVFSEDVLVVLERALQILDAIRKQESESRTLVRDKEHQANKTIIKNIIADLFLGEKTPQQIVEETSSYRAWFSGIRLMNTQDPISLRTSIEEFQAGSTANKDLLRLKMLCIMRLIVRKQLGELLKKHPKLVVLATYCKVMCSDSVVPSRPSTPT